MRLRQGAVAVLILGLTVPLAHVPVARAAAKTGRIVDFKIIQSKLPTTYTPTSTTFTMETNLSLTDPLLLARNFPTFVGAQPRREWRTIGDTTYFASSQFGAPTNFSGMSTYVVPTFDGRSDFDPSVLWKLLRTVSGTKVTRVGTASVAGQQVTNYRMSISTSRFVELQGIADFGTQAYLSISPANPILLLLENVIDTTPPASQNAPAKPTRIWSQSNPYAYNTDIPVTVSVARGGVTEIEFTGTHPDNVHQLFAETFTESTGSLHVAVPHTTEVLTPTPCLSTTEGSAPTLRVKSAYVPTIGSAFGVVTTADGRYSFVSNAVTNSVAVYSDSSFAPRLVRAVTMAVPAAGQPLGEVLTHDGKYLLVAEGRGAEVFDVTALEDGAKHADLGQIQATSGTGAIEVAVSPDDRFAFVTLEDSAEMAVFNLASAQSSMFTASGFVGDVPLGYSPVGMAIAPSGAVIYVTSEATAPGPSDGELSVVNLAAAETNPATVVVGSIDAGCSPVRVIVSPDGSVVWVSARGSNELLAFSAPSLLADPAHARVAQVEVGQSPVDLIFTNNATRIVVADSNRFLVPGAMAALSVVNPAAALAGQPALVGSVATGLFPREFVLEPNGSTLLVTDYFSSQLEAVSVASLAP